MISDAGLGLALTHDAENSASQHRNKLHFKIYSNRNDLIWFVTFYWIFGQINA